MRLRLSAELILGLVGMVFGYAFFRQADNIVYPSKVYPIFVSFLVMAISLAITLMALSRSKDFEPEIQDSFTMNTFLVMISVIIYTIAVNIVGFYVSSFVCILFLSVITAQNRATGRSYINTIIASLIFLGTVYFIFSYLLNSSISRGYFF